MARGAGVTMSSSAAMATHLHLTHTHPPTHPPSPSSQTQHQRRRARLLVLHPLGTHTLTARTRARTLIITGHGHALAAAAATWSPVTLQRPPVIMSSCTDTRPVSSRLISPSACSAVQCSAEVLKSLLGGSTEVKKGCLRLQWNAVQGSILEVQGRSSHFDYKQLLLCMHAA